MIGCAVLLSSPIQPVTATSRCGAFARRLESLRASHGPVNAQSSTGADARRLAATLTARKRKIPNSRFIAARELRSSALRAFALSASTIVPTASSVREGEIARNIIPSGVALLDDWLTGVREGGAHLLTGGTGSGKSSLALHFAEAGARRGQSVVMLVHGRADDVKSHARFLGLKLDAALRDGRLILLRYRSDFVHRATQVVSPEQVVSDLARIISPYQPARLVIDTLSPLVTSGPPVGLVMSALSDLLEQTGSTALLTFPEDLADGYDRNLEPLVQGAAAVIRLTREDANIRRAELVNIRYPAPAAATVRFVVRREVGIVTDHPIREDRAVLRVQ